MRSNLETAKSTSGRLLALAEIHHFLSQAIACDGSVEIQLDKVGRDGLANLFCLLAKECEFIKDMMED